MTNGGFGLVLDGSEVSTDVVGLSISAVGHKMNCGF